MYCNTNLMKNVGLYLNQHSSEHVRIWITEVRTSKYVISWFVERI
jgi:hypothetical protein